MSAARGGPFPIAFRVFHWTLALVVLVQSHGALRHALHHEEPGVGRLHLALLAGVEMLGAVLFLVPRLVRLGAGILLAVFAAAFVTHALRGEWNLTLLVYAAGAVAVALHDAYAGRRG